MILFGHLGIGLSLTQPLRRGLPRSWILFGAILPDLIDKPLYYGLVLATGRRAADLGLISGTRTFGHTAALLVLICILSWMRRSRALAAIALGFSTHLLLDGVTDYYFLITEHQARRSALFWPFLGAGFPVSPFQSVGEHVSSWKNVFFAVSEILGVLLLKWQIWKDEHKEEILAFFRKTSLRVPRLRRRRS